MMSVSATRIEVLGMLGKTCICFALVALLSMGIGGACRAAGADDDRDAGDPLREARNPAIGDAAITASIRSRLLWRAATSGLDIDVVTNAGKVRIDGSVYVAEQRELAGRIASDTAGVRAVDNAIVVFSRPPITGVAQSASAAVAAKAGLPVSDAWIVTHIESTFSLSPSVGRHGIVVSVSDGAVSLSGRAATREARTSAIEIAGHVRGVRSVDATRLAAE
jgi:osmotically-inducible protein OsmY